MKKVILDCDPGVDDAMAIVLALNSKKIDLVGITTVSGNVGVNQTSLNACRILDYFKITNLPVSKGAAHPLKATPVHAKSFHGNDGLGDSPLLPKTSERKLEPVHAVDFIIQSVEAGLKTIVATGPLTNIALAFKKNPRIMNKLDELIIMGGAVHEPGNVDSISEFNFYADPDAADYVLQRKVPKTLVSLDVTHKVILTPSDVDQLENTPSGKFVKSIIAHYQKASLGSGVRGSHLHDPLAMGYCIDKTFLTLNPAFIRVETEGKYTRGECVPEERSWVKITPNVNFAQDVDVNRFIDYFKKTISG